MKHVHVQYYAVLREQAGRNEETVETAASTPGELYAELQAKHGLRIAPAFLRVAINDEFCDWSRPLSAGDRIVYIPPVAGG